MHSLAWYPGNNTSFLLAVIPPSPAVNNIQYTAQFGNGVSGTIGLDDPSCSTVLSSPTCRSR